LSGFARSQVRIENNVIADSSYAGIDMRDTCSLTIRNNVLCSNSRAVAVFKEPGKGGNKLLGNTFWENETDTENIDKPVTSIEAKPGFVDAENGDFTLEPSEVKSRGHGLKEPAIIKKLWQRWQKRAEREEPFD